MGVFKRGKTYWYEFEFLGSRIRESSHSRNREVCDRLMRERKRDLELSRGGLKKISRPKLFGPAAEAYLLDREPHWEPKTRLVHSNSLAHLKPSLGKLTLGEITPSVISRYQRKRLKEEASPRSINIEVALIRLVLRKHKVWGNIEDEVKMLKERRDVGRALSEDETMRLLTAAKASASRSLYPAILVSIHTGLRNQELRLLRWSQIDLLDGSLVVGKSKTQGGEGRLVPLSRRALEALQEWRGLFPDALPSHYVFPREAYGLIGKKGTFGGTVAPYEVFPEEPIRSWKSAWQSAKKTAGVKARWHDLRHSFVQLVAESQASDATIQALAGWMSPKMIELYSHTRNAAKRKAISALDKPQDLDGPPNSHHSESRDGRGKAATN
jgi:integrase